MSGQDAPWRGGAPDRAGPAAAGVIRARTVPGEGEIRLAALQAGPSDGPLVILLHGFPETCESWRGHMTALAAAGLKVIAPTQRGYAGSSRPRGVAPYDLDRLTADVLAIMDAEGAGRASLVGHDWGALVAWWTASRHPERVRRLVALAAGHPAVWRAAMAEVPAQRRKSWYVTAFRVPVVPELLLRARGYRALCAALEGRLHPQTLTPEALAEARASWAEPGALTAMVNWYRAVARRRFAPEAAYAVAAPTLIIWGAQDAYGEPLLAERSAALCRDARVAMLPTTHWMCHDAPEETLCLILEALAPDREAGAGRAAPD